MTGKIPWSTVTDSLLEKYGGQAPRYTSYPTAVEWNERFDAPAFARALSAADLAADEPLSIYVHIPFCKKRCLFCGCASDVCTEVAEYDIYLDALRKDINAVAAHLPKRRRAAQLHLGGGTPTVLNSDRLCRLVGMLKDTFDFSDAQELALEAAPAVTSLEQIETLGRLGFNRISLGVQDFTPEVQQAVDRIQSADHTLSLIDTARHLGFAVNIDLMYGLPKQQLNSWQENLQQVISLRPSRLAVFGYAHVPWMRPHQRRMNEADLPDTNERLALFRAAHDQLCDAGYVYIGMDHFALPDDALAVALAEKRLSRNFQGYTVKQAAVLIGFGATAISDLGIAFAQNLPQTADYVSCAASFGLATFRGMETSAEDRLRRVVITEIMCNLTLDIEELEKRFEIDFFEHFAGERRALTDLEADGLIRMGEKYIEVTDRGRLFVRHVGLAFDTYSKATVESRRFSRTV